MHRPASPNTLRPALPFSRKAAATAAFSLIEVTLAIGIIAFAFVALFGLLPTGMATFRASVDATNDITMIQEMNAMVQVTEWANIDKIDSSKTGEEYYFDEEGRRTDSKKDPAKAADVRARRLYEVKLLVEKAYQPGTKTEMNDARRIIVVIGDIFRPQSDKDFKTVTTVGDLGRNGKPLNVRSRTILVSRMESESGS